MGTALGLLPRWAPMGRSALRLQKEGERKEEGEVISSLLSSALKGHLLKGMHLGGSQDQPFCSIAQNPRV